MRTWDTWRSKWSRSPRCFGLEWARRSPEPGESPTEVSIRTCDALALSANKSDESEDPRIVVIHSKQVTDGDHGVATGYWDPGFASWEAEFRVAT
ncbi:hypothetical protein GCM10017788_32190 [Amycolatopsis acidiphila]|nr:hypothetical protein GCM10017788_32190 [Amycolatopsis acidiphila]